MSYNTKNYMSPGGDELVIGGKLTVAEGATVTGLTSVPLSAATESQLGCIKVGAGLEIADGVLSVENLMTPAENQSESEAETVAELLADFNTLIGKLIAAGLMEEPDGDDES